jgi:hypothetical protein
MSCSNGSLAILDENRVSVVSACHSPSFAPCYFHYYKRYPAGCWCTLNFLQQNRVNTHDDGYGGVGDHGGCEGEVTKVRKDVHSSTGGSQTGMYAPVISRSIVLSRPVMGIWKIDFPV